MCLCLFICRLLSFALLRAAYSMKFGPKAKVLTSHHAI
uniref:Uncharacterized protein n=1 Tax=Arundo donax TaxID=35708 RepID=A0A0A9AW56_ARUDO